MPVNTYNPALISVITGAKIISGYSDDSQVTVERMTDSFAESVGADGHVTRSRTNDNRGTITVQLMQSSPSNDDLQAYATNDELNGTGTFPVLVRDASGRTICSGDQAWLVKTATAEYGRSITNRTWTIRVANLVMNVGGNNTL